MSSDTKPTLPDLDPLFDLLDSDELGQWLSRVHAKQSGWMNKVSMEKKDLKDKKEGIKREFYKLREKYSALEKNRNEMEGRLIAAEKSRNGMEERLETAERRLQVIEKSDPLAVVLIDGDGYKFSDNMVRQGASGGEGAAKQLLAAIANFLAGTKEAHQWKVVVHVVLNVDGLGKMYQKHGIVKQKDDFREFVVGFNRIQLFCKMADIGVGKEMADEQIKGYLAFYAKEYNCKQILFAGCHDTGYLPALKLIKSDDALPCISLVEHHCIRDGFRDLPFKIATLEGIFSKTDYQSTSAPSHRSNKASCSPFEMNSSHKRSRKPSFDAPYERPPARLDIYKLLVNEKGQRVDAQCPPVGRRDYDAFDALIYHRGDKYPCEKHHLLGTFNADRCEYSHVELSKREVYALASRARDYICKLTVDCRNPNCVYGHNCRYDPRCREGDRCRNAYLHGISKTPVERRNRSPSPKRLRSGY